MSSNMTAGTPRVQHEAALEHVGVLNRVLQLLGVGQGLYTTNIAKLWQYEHEQIWPEQLQSTSYAAVLASGSRLLLAYSCGFDGILLPSLEHYRRARVIGRLADLNALQLAVSRGLKPNCNVLAGAVLAGALDNVQFLWPVVRDQRSDWGRYLGNCVKPVGSVAVAQFLVAQGVEFGPDAMQAAAGHGDLSLVQYLSTTYGVRGQWGQRLVTSAASGRHLKLLEWAQSQCHEFKKHTGSAVESAAAGGQIAVLEWLHQHHTVAYSSQHLEAAIKGTAHRPEICQHLVSVGCPVTPWVFITAVEFADLAVLQCLWEVATWQSELDESDFFEMYTLTAEYKKLDKFKWLREQAQCPWNISKIAEYVLPGRENLCVLQYLVDQGELTDKQLTELLEHHACEVDDPDLECAKCLRANGAPWPAVLRIGYWSQAALTWCRSEGCTAPLLEVQSDDSDGDQSDLDSQETDNDESDAED